MESSAGEQRQQRPSLLDSASLILSQLAAVLLVVVGVLALFVSLYERHHKDRDDDSRITLCGALLVAQGAHSAFAGAGDYCCNNRANRHHAATICAAASGLCVLVFSTAAASSSRGGGNGEEDHNNTDSVLLAGAILGACVAVCCSASLMVTVWPRHLTDSSGANATSDGTINGGTTADRENESLREPLLTGEEDHGDVLDGSAD